MGPYVEEDSMSMISMGASGGVAGSALSGASSLSGGAAPGCVAGSGGPVDGFILMESSHIYLLQEYAGWHRGACRADVGQFVGLFVSFAANVPEFIAVEVSS